MFGRRELLMLVAWVGLISSLAWLAQAFSPQTNDGSPPVISAASNGVPVVLQAGSQGEQHPLLPRLVVAPAVGAPLIDPASQRQEFSLRGSGSRGPSQTLQVQCVRWQI